MARQEIISLENGEKIRLSEREKLFCEYYLADAGRNASEAVRMAGYAEKSAAITASRLLINANVKKYIDSKTNPILDELAIKQKKVLEEWAKLAFSDPNQDISSKSEIPSGFEVTHNFKTLTIDGMEVDSHEKQVAYKLNHKVKALMMLSETLGLIKPKEATGEGQTTVHNLFLQINNHLQKP
jgi:phage terminase small subunit